MKILLHNLFSSKTAKNLLKDIQIGIEKECLRVDSKGHLSMKPHPKGFGAPLTHPYISTDFSEAQPELCSPPFKTIDRAYDFLFELHQYLYDKLRGEFLWPISSPCILPKAKDIPLAYYGTSSLADYKTTYRRGLVHRYGPRMQTMSGIHFNFSLGPDVLKYIQQSLNNSQTIKEFKTDLYLHLIRNFLRIGWINSYLFGASPYVHTSYLDKSHPALEKYKDVFLGKYATSLRMSELGYYSKVQCQVAVSQNDLPSYIHDMKKALNDVVPEFDKFPHFKNGVRSQLSPAVFQIEAEHYARIRPKPLPEEYFSHIKALENEGIGYVEVRTEDLSPFSPIGLTKEQLYFLKTLLFYCIEQPSPPIFHEEEKWICENQNEVGLYGRKPNLSLIYNKNKKKKLVDWGREILESLLEIAELLDDVEKHSFHTQSIKKQLDKLSDPTQTPSYQLIEAISSSSYQDYFVELAHNHRLEVQNKKLPSSKWDHFENITKQSIKDLKEIESRDLLSYAGYENLELSTQLVIREAHKREIDVQVLDPKESFIRLKKNRKSCILKQATKTSLDSYLSYLIMENKSLTKHLLDEIGLSIPKGNELTSENQLMPMLSELSTYYVIVKPNTSNYGIGITKCKRQDVSTIRKAVHQALKHSNSVVIEEFIEGKEYRFFVVDGKTKAVCRRDPPHVIGNGKLTVQQLVEKKNKQLKNVKHHLYHIQLGDIEKQVLQDQNLHFSSVLSKGKKAFLRYTSNVSTGGDSVNVTDQVLSDYKHIAERAAVQLGAFFCGVDMIIQHPHLKPLLHNHAIIELNFNPALYLHRFPIKGGSIPVEKYVLDSLGF